MTTLVELIAHKRDGRAHESGEIQRLIAALGSGDLADYQMSAWLMAAFLRGLDALRDVTATVESIPLITASILSKKLAEGIDALVLDVKVGRGAFMKDVERARALAKSLVAVAARGGKGVTALLTDMDHPLGLTIGNALETIEAIEVLHGRGPQDVIDVTLALAAEMLVLGKVAENTQE